MRVCATYPKCRRNIHACPVSAYTLLTEDKHQTTIHRCPGHSALGKTLEDLGLQSLSKTPSPMAVNHRVDQEERQRQEHLPLSTLEQRRDALAPAKA